MSAARRLAIVELLVLVLAAALAYHDRAPAELARWALGVADPIAFVHGLNNLFAMASIGSLWIPGAGGDRLRGAAGVWFALVLAIFPALAQVEVRRTVDERPGNEAPYHSHTHDGGVLQTEMAVDALLHGEDPYAVSYARPPMSRAPDSDPAGWRSLGYEGNPAYDHIPYPPGALLVSLPPQLVVGKILGWWDERFLYLAAAIAFALVVASMAPAGAPRRIAALVALGSPLVAPFLEVGRNDVLVLLPLALFARALMNERTRAAAIWLGVAIAMKQFAIFALPFVFLRADRKAWWPAIAIPFVVTLPFFLWNPGAFLTDVLVWNFGGGGDPYPVRWDGWGITPFAYAFGKMKMAHSSGPNPFAWLPIPAILGALVGLARWVKRAPTGERVLLATGGLLWVSLFTSRFFADNYVAVPVLCMVVPLLALTERHEQRSDQRKTEEPQG